MAKNDSPTNFPKQTTFCPSGMFSLPNDTNFNQFHPELFAVQSLAGGIVGSVVAIKVFDIATSSSYYYFYYYRH